MLKYFVELTLKLVEWKKELESIFFLQYFIFEKVDLNENAMVTSA